MNKPGGRSVTLKRPLGLTMNGLSAVLKCVTAPFSAGCLILQPHSTCRGDMQAVKHFIAD